MAVRSRFRDRGRRGERSRRLQCEQLEERRMLSLTHLYTFNDGLANDWIGSAHGTLFNGASIAGGQLVLANDGVTSGQTSAVQYARLGANLLGSGDATIAVWFTVANAGNWARVIDVGSQVGANGDSYLAFTPQSGFDDSRAMLRPSGGAERVATGATTDDGAEHMAAIVVDTAANLLRLYVDGAEASTTALDGANAGSVNDSLAFLGRSLFNSDPGFTGSINELRVYDDARSAGDIAADAAAGPSTATKSPLVRQMEHLDRGIVAVRRSSTQAYIGWRLLGTDPSNVAFNIYRSAGGGAAVKLNASPLTTTTDYVDSTVNFSVGNTYFVRAVIGGVEQANSETATLAAGTPVQQFLSVPLQIPPGGTTPSGENYTYSANDTSVGDLDGDGEYEIIVKWDPSNSKDNSQSGYTGNVYMDAYKLDGTRLWRIDLGRNIRAGAHYTQFLVYDFDGDGRSEMVLRTAPGTVDGLGNNVILPGDNPNADYRNSSGYILSGPEYLTVFDGYTGANLSTINFSPVRGTVSSWGDSYGNRVDRFLATVAYLDGVRPSIVMTRGYYAKTALTAFDWRNGQLTQRWAYDTTARGGSAPYEGQGTHSIAVADVDADGKDEIILGAAAFDDTGTGLYTTGLGHGDALHISDMDASRPGLEVFQVHEDTAGNGHVGASLRDARTGTVINAHAVTSFINEDGETEWPDVGRGVAFDIDPNHPGYEYWDSSHDSIYNTQGLAIYGRGNAFYNFGVWWDADPLRELLDGTTIADWNYTIAGRQNYDLDPATSGSQSFAPNTSSNNSTKKTPALSADILGDWREEVIWRRSDNTALHIYTTIIPATSRIYTLMHDPTYRQAIAWQNVAYNQPPHPGFFLGAGMAPAPTPQIYTVRYAILPGDYSDDGVVDAGDYSVWRDAMGSYAVLPNDTTPSSVSQADYDLWVANFGAIAPAFATGGASLGVESISIPGVEALPANSLAVDDAFAALATIPRSSERTTSGLGSKSVDFLRRSEPEVRSTSLLVTCLRRAAPTSETAGKNTRAAPTAKSYVAEYGWFDSVDRGFESLSDELNNFCLR
jgi:rhamnogalacturonan endolyase